MLIFYCHLSNLKGRRCAVFRVERWNDICNLLPTSVIDQLDKKRRAFLWCADKMGKATLLAAW